MAIIPAATGRLSALAQRFADVRRTTEKLCAPLTAEDQMVQSMPEASPTKWHQAHTTWFFETFVLAPHLDGYKPFDPDFRFLFNSYYKQLAGEGAPAHPLRSLRGTFSRPSLQQIQEYRRYVDEHVFRLIDDASPEAAALIELGTHHEQQHQELIVTDIKHAFWSHPLRPAYSEQRARTSPKMARESAGEYLGFQGGIVRIGYEGEGFCFDNETPSHEVLLAPYRIASRLVTNRDYVEFMNDGGYRRSDLWLSDGWDRVCAERWSSPFYWEHREGEWHEFTLCGMRPVDPAAPVCHVSYYEADAFARWAAARLPREEEWENAAKRLSAAGCEQSGANFLESSIFHPIRETAVAPSTIDHRLSTFFGQVWQWTASAYLPYPKFRPAAGVVGEYNGKFMSGQMVLRGGSCATPASHMRSTYRNFFPPHARWQFMGIRLANDGD